MELSVKHLVCLVVFQLQIISLYLTCVQSVSFEEYITLTPQEVQALVKFRRRVVPILPKEYMKHDLYLIRWLRARNLNIQLAEEMLKSNLRWRREQKMDTIHKEDWSDMAIDFPYTCNTFDKHDRPIAVVPLGQWNFRRTALTGKMPRLQRYMNKIMDELYLRVIDGLYKGHNATQVKIIFNMDGFNQVQHACPQCIVAYTNFLSNYENRYPGGVDQVIQINTPPFFDMVLNSVRPVLSSDTQKALKIFGPNKKVWIKYLDREISRNQRSIELGGTRKY